ncbi:adenylyl-sulfate kinase, partial [Escherichia coli]|nr:adenylyl-sulfate kinase [Escherichia coli]
SAAPDLHQSQAAGRLTEVLGDPPLATCEARDPHGLYETEPAGALRKVTGTDFAYADSESAEIPPNGAQLETNLVQQ